MDVTVHNGPNSEENLSYKSFCHSTGFLATGQSLDNISESSSLKSVRAVSRTSPPVDTGLLGQREDRLKVTYPEQEQLNDWRTLESNGRCRTHRETMSTHKNCDSRAFGTAAGNDIGDAVNLQPRMVLDWRS